MSCICGTKSSRGSRSRGAKDRWPASGWIPGAWISVCSNRHGRLIGNPYHYRDGRTDGMLAEAFRRTPRARSSSKPASSSFRSIRSINCCQWHSPARPSWRKRRPFSLCRACSAIGCRAGRSASSASPPRRSATTHGSTAGRRRCSQPWRSRRASSPRWSRPARYSGRCNSPWPRNWASVPSRSSRPPVTTPAPPWPQCPPPAAGTAATSPGSAPAPGR